MLLAGGASSGVVVLHARSVKCGKLENGCWVHVPSWLIGRRKKHFVVLGRSRNSSSASREMIENASSTSTGREEYGLKSCWGAMVAYGFKRP